MNKEKIKDNAFLKNTYELCRNIGYMLSPKIATKINFYISMGYKLNLDNPKSYNEKVNYLKFNDDLSLKTICADKLKVRDYIKEKGYGNILNKLYVGGVDSIGEIDFGSLPDKFVIKTNHSCGTNTIVFNKDKLDLDKLNKQYDIWMKEKHGRAPYEPQYLNIIPKIIVEENMCEAEGEFLEDYKFYCTEGKLMAISIIIRQPKPKLVHVYYFDSDLNLIETNYKGNDEAVPKLPNNISEMIKIACDLSKDFKFVRVDLYDLNDEKIVFGELTFTPTGGFKNELYMSRELDYKMGEEIKLK